MKTLAAMAYATAVLGQSGPLQQPWAGLLSFGPLGVLVVLYVLGWIPSKGELDRTILQRDRAEAQRDAFAERTMTDVLPLLGDVSRTMVPTLDRVAGHLDRLADQAEHQAEEMRRMVERLDRLDRR